MKKMLCKISSVCLTLALVLSLSVLPAASSLTASAAASHEGDTDFVPLTIENSYLKGDMAAKGFNNLEITELVGGGLHYAFSNGNAANSNREGYGTSVKVDGLNLYFDNLAADTSSDRYDSENPGNNARMLVVIGDNALDNKGPKCWGSSGFALGFELSPNDGGLALCRNNVSTMVVEKTALFTNEEALKYENISGKAFSYSFAARAEGGYTLTVSVDGFEPIKAKITNEQVTGLLHFKNPDASYVMVTTIAINEKSAFSVDFLGLSEKVISPVQSYIDAINELTEMSDDVLLYSGNVLKATRAAYDALDEASQALVTNSANLAVAEERYQTLAKKADSDLVIMNTKLAKFTQAKAYGETVGNIGDIKVTENSDGGIHVNLPRGKNLVGDIEVYASNVNLDGVKLQFDNFNTNVDGNGVKNYAAGQMAILFGNGEFGHPSFTDSLALVFNPNTGTLYAIYGNGTSKSNIDANPIITSDLLKGANFEYRRFSLSVKSNPDDIVTDDKGHQHNGFIVTVEISGKTLTGTIPYTNGLDKVSFWATDNVAVALSLATPYENGGTRGYTVDWIGVGEGVVNGKNGNYELTGDNTIVTNGLLDQGYVLLNKQTETGTGCVEFKVQSDKADVRLMGYSNSSLLNVYVDGEQTKQLKVTKFQNKWYTLFENLDPNVEHTVKLENAHASLISLNGVYVNLKGDINNDGAVNGSDLTVMRKYLLGVENTGILVERADLSGNDGQVNLLDLVALKKLISGYTATINNSALMPAYYTTTANDVDNNNAPNWTKDLIIGEVNLRTATEEGTIQAATKVLDHYAEMGVNGLWITPVFDGGLTGNGYGNLGINTIDSNLTGMATYENGWAVLKTFIDEAHSRNIRVILDVVFRGVQSDSKLVQDKPKWFTYDAEYKYQRFLWEDPSVNSEIAQWYVDNIVDIAEKTGCDGFRYDMMPSTVSKCNVPVEKNIVDALHQAGKYLFIMSESENNRNGLYATETVSIPEALSYEYYAAPYNLFLDNHYDIAGFITSGATALNGAGAHKYYTYSLANHDFKTSAVNGSRIAVGYQAIFSPFIPVIYLGEEWNNPHNSTNQNDQAFYYNKIDWSAMDNAENRAFYEDIKAMIRIRRTYSDLFNINAAQFKDSNICGLTTSGAGVSAYARYAGNRAALIVPNNMETTSNVNITVSLADLGLESYNSFTVRDAETGSVIAEGTSSDVSSLTVPVNKKDQRVLIITGK